MKMKKFINAPETITDEESVAWDLLTRTSLMWTAIW